MQYKLEANNRATYFHDREQHGTKPEQYYNPENSARLIPRKENNRFVVGFTDKELRGFEKELGLAEGYMSTASSNDSFWEAQMNVFVGRDGLVLNEEDVYDRLKIGYLRNRETVTFDPSKRGDAHFPWICLSEDAVSEQKLSKAQIEENAWMAFGKMTESDHERFLLGAMNQRITGLNAAGKKTRVLDFMKEDHKRFLDELGDKQLAIKADLQDAIQRSIWRRQGQRIYDENMEEVADSFRAAVDFLADAMNGNVYISLQKKLKEAKKSK